MATIDVIPRMDTGGWEWRVLDARGQLRLAGTHPTRDEAVATGSFWLTQVLDPEG